MAYVYTYSCAHCHGSAYADTDGDCANADCGPVDSDTGTDGYSNTHADPHRYTYTDYGPVNSDTGTDGYTSTKCGVR